MSLPRALALLVLLPSACGGGAERDKPVRRSANTQVSASDLYSEYSKLRGVELLEAYAGGVLVTGTVARATELGEEGLQIDLAIARGAVALAFADLGAEARHKGMRPGASLRARCQVGGKPQEVLFLKSCVLF
jgi:hypothetical protein